MSGGCRHICIQVLHATLSHHTVPGQPNTRRLKLRRSWHLNYVLHPLKLSPNDSVSQILLLLPRLLFVAHLQEIFNKSLLVLDGTLEIFLIFLTAEEDDAARSESMGGRKNRGLDAGRRFTVNVSVLPDSDGARLERLLNDWFPSSSCRNESLLFRALPWMDGGCKPRRLVDWPILLNAAPRTHDSEDDMPSLSKESGQSPIPSIYLLSLWPSPTNHSTFNNMLLSTGLSYRCVNTVTWRHSLPRIRLRGCWSEPTTLDCYCNCLLLKPLGRTHCLPST